MLEPLWRVGDDTVQASQGFVVAGPAFAAWTLATGRLDLGLSFADWMLGRLEPEEVWRITGEMRYWRGRILLAAGDLSRAEADLLEAHSRLAHAGVVILTWKIDAALADLYHERGDMAAEAATRETHAAELPGWPTASGTRRCDARFSAGLMCRRSSRHEPDRSPGAA